MDDSDEEETGIEEEKKDTRKKVKIEIYVDYDIDDSNSGLNKLK